MLGEIYLLHIVTLWYKDFLLGHLHLVMSISLHGAVSCTVALERFELSRRRGSENTHVDGILNKLSHLNNLLSKLYFIYIII